MHILKEYCIFLSFLYKYSRMRDIPQEFKIFFKNIGFSRRILNIPHKF